MVKQEIAKSTVVGTVAGTAAGYGTKLMIYSLGFGKLGPIAGTVAAGIQSSIGNVAAGSAFSTAQAIGMTGIGLQVGCFVGIAAGGWYLTRSIINKNKK